MTPTEQIQTMRAALNKAAERFREYTELHASDAYETSNEGRAEKLRERSKSDFILAEQCESAAALTSQEIARAEIAASEARVSKLFSCQSVAWDTERIPLPGEAEKTITGRARKW